MGGGSWTASSFASYSTSKGRSYDVVTCSLAGNYTSQEMYTQKYLNEKLNPKNVLRECVDSEEHPNTIPVILALDVTGSMGDAAVEVAKDINVVMTRLFKEVKDIEFMIMGIGDLACDHAPIQISQFESDIRIAEQMDQVYFEYGGGGNAYESYTAAWYMGSRHTKLDCLSKRCKRGIIITLGDEQLNPYLPKSALMNATGDNLQGDVETKDLYREASEKFDIYHIDVDHRRYRDSEIDSSWRKYLDENHYKSVKLNAVTDTIVEMILDAINVDSHAILNEAVQTNDNGEIVW
jgi:nitrogen regulatory protein PII